MIVISAFRFRVLSQVPGLGATARPIGIADSSSSSLTGSRSLFRRTTSMGRQYDADPPDQIKLAELREDTSGLRLESLPTTRYPGGSGRFIVQTTPHSKSRSPTWSYSLKW